MSNREFTSVKSDIREDIIAEALRSVEKYSRRKVREMNESSESEATGEETQEIILDPDTLFESGEGEAPAGPLPVQIPVDGSLDGRGVEQQGEADPARKAKRRVGKAFIEKLRTQIKALTEERNELEAALEEKEREARRNYEMALRAAADLENFKKRAEREKQELELFGTEKFLRELLPVVDNLERALQHAEEKADLDTLLEGVRMTLVQLSSCLSKFHVTRIESSSGTPFNPAVHEAMWEEETTEYPPNTIAREVLSGYLLHGRLLRASLVSVARAPREESVSEDLEEKESPASASTSVSGEASTSASVGRSETDDAVGEGAPVTGNGVEGGEPESAEEGDPGESGEA